jgi:hypothetical protein
MASRGTAVINKEVHIMSVANLPEVEHASAASVAGHQEAVSQHPPCKEQRFHCYAYAASKGRYIAECLDLDIIVEENTLHKAVSGLNDAVKGYLAVALEGDTKGLVPRKSPLKRRLMYRYRVLAFCLLNGFKRERQARRLKLFDVGPSLCY